MKHFLTTLFVAFAFSTVSFCQENFDVKTIPEKLKEGMNAIVRDYTEDISIEALDKVHITTHYVITVLNDKGDNYAVKAIALSKMNKLKDVYGTVYDSSGKEVYSFKSSDFIERNLYAGFAAYTDYIVKEYAPHYRKYPYTVEYFIEQKFDYTFLLPQWHPVQGHECATEHASLMVTLSKNEDLRFKVMNADIVPQITTDDNKVYKWAVSNLSPQKKETMGSSSDINPFVLLAIDNFSFGGYSGNMNTWNSFGKFLYELNENRNILSPEITEKVKQLTAGISDDHKKVSAVYKYMQNSTRYVSIQYGIGGLQTLDAAFLCKNQYGDCKALSNYTMSMLNVIGITSYPVVISSGTHYQKLMTDFPSSQFDHVILCVPFAKDTMWLECTSSDQPANYLGYFTEDRDALMITPEGGVLVHTPSYDALANQTISVASIKCAGEGNLKVDLKTKYCGIAAQEMLHTLNNVNTHEKEQFLSRKFGLASYTLDKYSFSQVDTETVPAMIEDAKITATGMYTKTGQRSFVQMDVAPVHLTIPDNDKPRKTSFYISESFSILDTFELTPPVNCDVEFIPDPQIMNYPFGTYHCEIVQKEDKLILTRKFVEHKGVYDAALFADYEKFTDKVNSEAHKKVVLKNKS